MSNKKPSTLSSAIIWLKTSPSKFFYWWASRKEKPRHERHQWALNPAMQGLYWVLTFLLAAAASVFSNHMIVKSTNTATGNTATPTESQEISAALIYSYIESFFSNISSAGWVFIILAIFSALFFAYTAWIKSLREDFIFHTIQTNPPQGFWEKFEEAIVETNRLYDLIQEIAFRDKVYKEDIEQCELGVRTILDYLINLVLCWDTANTERKVIYRANIMDVTYFSEDPEYTLGKNIDLTKFNEDFEQIKNELGRFIHQPVTIHYSGVVELSSNKYTTTTETKESEPDLTIKPILLPFCFVNETCNKKFHTNLRGAPYAVATETPDYVDSVAKIVSHYEEFADPKSSRILSNLKRYYFQKNTPAKSILSIPLKVKNEDGELKIRWVLNIYRNQPKMLYNREKNKQFTQIISSIIAPLQGILDMIELGRSNIVESPLDTNVANEQDKE